MNLLVLLSVLFAASAALAQVPYERIRDSQREPVIGSPTLAITLRIITLNSIRSIAPTSLG